MRAHVPQAPLHGWGWVTHVVQELTLGRHTRATFSVLPMAFTHFFFPCFSKSCWNLWGEAEVRAVWSLSVPCGGALSWSSTSSGLGPSTVTLPGSVVAGTPAADPATLKGLWVPRGPHIERMDDSTILVGTQIPLWTWGSFYLNRCP